MSIQTLPTIPDQPLLICNSPGVAPSKTSRLYAGDILASAFAITVATWITAYICRMPLVQAPAKVTVCLMLTAIFFGGLMTARYSQKGLAASLLAGALSGILDILILGSLINSVSQSASAPTAALWISGSILTNAAIASLGGLFGILLPSPHRAAIPWISIFALVLTLATLPLITAGGLVTAFHAGLAVPDWPTSKQFNMFLLPLSLMQSDQGTFYEHAHRLMGSLVGLTSLTLAIYITIAEDRRWIKAFAWTIFLAVCIQGILGGTRVTEKSIALAITHGIFAQIVFASMACLAAATTPTFRTSSSRECPPTDRQLNALLVASIIIQLTLGALVRHIDTMLLVHITMAAFVATLALACAIRAVVLHADFPPLRKTGIAIIVTLALQLLLGIIALALRTQSVSPTEASNAAPTVSRAVMTTAHQANGALLLALAATLGVYTYRFLTVPPPRPMAHAALPA